ncbi:MAG: hypothetical protein AB7E76_09360 [Deferribacterales bacterium]
MFTDNNEYKNEIELLCEEEAKERMKSFWSALIANPDYKKFLYYYILTSEKQYFKNDEAYRQIEEELETITKNQNEEDVYHEFLEVIKKLLPDTEPTNKDQIIKKCVSNPDFIRHVAINSKTDRDYYDAFMEVMKMLFEDKISILELPPEAYTVWLSFTCGALNPTQAKKKVLITEEHRKVFSVWALNEFFKVKPSTTVNGDKNGVVKTCGFDLVANAEYTSYEAMKTLWSNYRRKNTYKFYRLSEIEDLPVIITDENKKLLFEIND